MSAAIVASRKHPSTEDLLPSTATQRNERRSIAGLGRRNSKAGTHTSDPPIELDYFIEQSTDDYHGASQRCSLLPEDNLETSRPDKLHIHPLSTVLVVLWMVYIAVMLYLFESAVRGGNENRDEVLDMFNNTLIASFLQVIFTQAHTPITAFHLSRLAMSALHHPNTAPLHWRELCWSADRAWKGPLGMWSVLYGAVKARVFVSRTFLLFVATIITTLITPPLLSAAYLLGGEVMLYKRENPNMLNDTAMSLSSGPLSLRLQSQPSHISQRRLGDALWSSGLPLESLFNSSIYHPPGASGPPYLNDFFFSASLHHGMIAQHLPGAKYSGGCTVISDDSSLTVDESLEKFHTLCEDNGLELSEFLGNVSSTIIPRSAWGETTNFTFCGRTADPWANILNATSNVLDDSASALAWISQYNRERVYGHTDETTYWNVTALIQGVVQCNSTLTLGHADMRSQDMTFSNFAVGDDWGWTERRSLLLDENNMTSESSGPTYAHPLPAAMDMLSPRSSGSTRNGTLVGDVISKMWFHKLQANLLRPDDVPSGPPFELSLFADLIWWGSTYMAIPMVILYAEPKLLGVDYFREYPTTTLARRSDYFIPTVVTLCIWAILMLYLTLTLLRPTFASELGSYVVARLQADRPDLKLVEGYCAGDIDRNPKMSRKFERVGDTKAGSLGVGHISVGGSGLLSGSDEREYK